MRTEIWSRWQDERGVSAVIGAILVFMIAAAAFGTVQAYFVPQWNKDVEHDHLNAVINDMMTLKSDIEDVAVSQEPKSSNIHLGVRYPNRMFLANPGTGVAGSLSSDNVGINIEYTIDAPGNPTITASYNSNRINYEAPGTIDSPKLVYEHGVIIRDYGGESASADEQSLIVGDEIFVPVITGNLTSISSLDITSIETRPLSQSYIRSRIQSVEITMDTNYPEVWEQLLAGTSTPETTVTVDLDEGKIIITNTAIKQISFPAVDITADALYAGLVTFSDRAVPVTYGSIDISQDYPCAIDIDINSGSDPRTQSTITATVRNATAPFDIHANLTGLTNNPETADMSPDFSSPDPIDVASWDLPNENTVRWTDIDHPQYNIGDVIIVSFWVINTENNMQFVTQRAFQRKNTNSWY